NRAEPRPAEDGAGFPLACAPARPGRREQPDGHVQGDDVERRLVVEDLGEATDDFRLLREEADSLQPADHDEPAAGACLHPAARRRCTPSRAGAASHAMGPAGGPCATAGVAGVSPDGTPAGGGGGAAWLSCVFFPPVIRFRSGFVTNSTTKHKTPPFGPLLQY